MCRFGQFTVPAVILSDSHITCTAPIASKYGRYSVYFSVNGVDFQSTSFSFEYTAAPIILSISPPLGPDGGGSRVVLRGTNLGYRGGSTFCDFTSSMSGQKVTKSAGNKYKVVGIWDANRPFEVVCITPPQQPGIVNVRVSTNGQQYSSDSKTFEYYSAESVTSVNPPTGVIQGGYTVFLRGTNFMNSTTLTCMFGLNLAPANYISEGEISCIVPSSRNQVGPSTVAVKVSNNGIDFSPLGMAFTFVQSVDIQRVYPISGPISGGSLVYFVTRLPVSASAVVCLFNGRTAPVVQVNGAIVICRTPFSIPNTVQV